MGYYRLDGLYGLKHTGWPYNTQPSQARAYLDTKGFVVKGFRMFWKQLTHFVTDRFVVGDHLRLYPKEVLVEISYKRWAWDTWHIGICASLETIGLKVWAIRSSLIFGQDLFVGAPISAINRGGAQFHFHNCSLLSLPESSVSHFSFRGNNVDRSTMFVWGARKEGRSGLSW